MTLSKISIYIERNTKIKYRKCTIYKATLYLKTILLKNECILKAVRVNCRHCGRFIPYVVSCNLSLREVSSNRVVQDTRNLPTNFIILHFK